jgi:type II secretory pathway pseudopilin PulG
MLVEILLALAITGLIAAGVASLLMATASGTKDRQELRQRNVRVDVLAHRIDGAIRSSSMLLARDSRTLVLWTGDTNKNGAVNLSELRRIEYDNSGKQIICYEAPATLPAASNTAYDLATTTAANFLTATAALRGTTSFPGTVWGNNVMTWDTSPTTGSRTTRLIGYRFSIRLPDSGTHSARSSVTMRGTSGNAG